MRTKVTAIMLAAAALLASCGEKVTTEKIEFPQQKEITVDGAGEYLLEFHAAADWKLLSSAPWVQFEDDGVKVYDISGKDGDVSVNVIVSDNGQGFDDDNAEVKLNMQGTEKTVLSITRAARTYKVNLYDAEGKEVDVLDITHDDFRAFTISANFTYMTDLLPAVEFSTVVAGAAGQKKEFTARIEENSITRPISASDGVKLIVRTSEGELVREFPVVYEGIDENFLKVKAYNGQVWLENELYQVIAYPDGKTLRRGFGKYEADGSITSGSYTFLEGYVENQVIALNDRFNFVIFEVDEKGDICHSAETWIHASVSADDPRIVHVSADASDTYRIGCVLAVPAGQYESVLAKTADGGNYQRVKLSLKDFIVTEVVQCNPETLEFDFRDGVNDWNRLHGYKVHTADTQEGAKMIENLNYFFNNEAPIFNRVYEAWINAGTSVMVFPMYRENADGDFTKDNTLYRGYKIYNTRYQEDKEMMDVKKGSASSFWDDWYMYYTHVYTIPYDKDYFYIVYRTRDNVNDKVLKINVKK